MGMWWLVPLAVAMVCGTACPLLGTLLVVQQRVLSTQVMAYGVLPGLVAAQGLGMPPAVGGLLAALLTLFLAESLGQRSCQRDQDAIHTVVLAGSLSIGVLLLHAMNQDAELESLLFGDLLLSGLNDLVAVVTGLLLLLLLLNRRFTALQWLGLDPQAAADAGLSLRPTQRLLAVLTAWILVSAAQAIGVILVMALLCAPTVIALPQAKSMNQALWRAAQLGIALSTVGFVLALVCDWPPGPTITLVAMLAVVVQSIAGRKGMGKE